MIQRADPAHRIPTTATPGYVVLRPTRVVYWTGRVAIGLLHQRKPPRSERREAEFLQKLLQQRGSK